MWGPSWDKPLHGKIILGDTFFFFFKLWYPHRKSAEDIFCICQNNPRIKLLTPSAIMYEFSHCKWILWRMCRKNLFEFVHPHCKPLVVIDFWPWPCTGCGGTGCHSMHLRSLTSCNLILYMHHLKVVFTFPIWLNLLLSHFTTAPGPPSGIICLFCRLWNHTCCKMPPNPW